VELPSETSRASSLQKYNKLYIVASCWTIIDIQPWVYVCMSIGYTLRLMMEMYEHDWPIFGTAGVNIVPLHFVTFRYLQK